MHSRSMLLRVLRDRGRYTPLSYEQPKWHDWRWIWVRERTDPNTSKSDANTPTGSAPLNGDRFKAAGGHYRKWLWRPRPRGLLQPIAIKRA